MAKTKKREFGDIGEDIVCKLLLRKGYKIVERNYLKPWGEIDIIAENDKNLVFVEVKSVSREGGSCESFRPEENLHPQKLRRLYRTIQTYLIDKKVPEDRAWRIDLACVFMDFSTRKARVEVIENIS